MKSGALVSPPNLYPPWYKLCKSLANISSTDRSSTKLLGFRKQQRKSLSRQLSCSLFWFYWALQQEYQYFPAVLAWSFKIYQERNNNNNNNKSRRQIYELIALRYKICRIASLWYLFNSVFITNFSHTRSKASLIERILRSGSGYVLQKSVNGLWLVNVNVGCV